MGLPLAATVWGFLILAIVIAVFVWLPANIAKRKGRSPWLWAVLGFLFPLITLIVIAVLPRKTPTVGADPVEQPE